tara:strand:+ start:84 stop:1043 length:960 start_codon:yes stop_codon:yes gene_type:complete
MKNMKNIKNIFSVLFFAYFLYLIVSTEIDFKLFFELNSFILLILFFLKTLAIVLNGFFNKILIGAFGVNLKFYDAIYISIITFLGNFYLPGRSGGALRMVYLNRKFKLTTDKIISSNLLFFVVGILLNGLTSLFWLFLNKEQIENYFLISVLLFLFISLFCIFILNKRFSINKNRKTKEKNYISKALNYISELKESWNVFFEDGKRLYKLIGIYLLIYITFLIEIYLIINTLNLYINFSSVGLYNSISGISNLIGITPSSLGVKESLLVMFNNLILIDSGSLITISIFERLISIIYTGIPLIYFFWLNRKGKLRTLKKK